MKDRETLIKQLIYRSCNRGCKETDILLGEFAKTQLLNFDNNQLTLFAYILEQPDNDIYDWICGNKPLAEDIDQELILKIQQYIAF